MMTLKKEISKRLIYRDCSNFDNEYVQNDLKTMNHLKTYL